MASRINASTRSMNASRTRASGLLRRAAPLVLEGRVEERPQVRVGVVLLEPCGALRLRAELAGLQITQAPGAVQHLVRHRRGFGEIVALPPGSALRSGRLDVASHRADEQRPIGLEEHLRRRSGPKSDRPRARAIAKSIGRSSSPGRSCPSTTNGSSCLFTWTSNGGASEGVRAAESVIRLNSRSPPEAGTGSRRARCPTPRFARGQRLRADGEDVDVASSRGECVHRDRAVQVDAEERQSRGRRATRTRRERGIVRRRRSSPPCGRTLPRSTPEGAPLPIYAPPVRSRATVHPRKGTDVERCRSSRRPRARRPLYRRRVVRRDRERRGALPNPGRATSVSRPTADRVARSRRRPDALVVDGFGSVQSRDELSRRSTRATECTAARRVAWQAARPSLHDHLAKSEAPSEGAESEWGALVTDDEYEGRA